MIVVLSKGVLWFPIKMKESWKPSMILLRYLFYNYKNWFRYVDILCKMKEILITNMLDFLSVSLLLVFAISRKRYVSFVIEKCFSQNESGIHIITLESIQSAMNIYISLIHILFVNYIHGCTYIYEFDCWKLTQVDIRLWYKHVVFSQINT